MDRREFFKSLAGAAVVALAPIPPARARGTLPRGTALTPPPPMPDGATVLSVSGTTESVDVTAAGDAWRRHLVRPPRFDVEIELPPEHAVGLGVGQPYRCALAIGGARYEWDGEVTAIHEDLSPQHRVFVTVSGAASPVLVLPDGTREPLPARTQSPPLSYDDAHWDDERATWWDGVCPECGSGDISETDWWDDPPEAGGAIIGTRWRCWECGMEKEV